MAAGKLLSILKDHTAERHRQKRQRGREKGGNHPLHLVHYSTPESRGDYYLHFTD